MRIDFQIVANKNTKKIVKRKKDNVQHQKIEIMLKEKLAEVFDSFENYNVMIIGDAMLDSYLWGDVNRISPEAPVPIISCTKREHRMGGAANVALNIRALGAKPILCSVIGEDSFSNDFIERLEKKKLSSVGIMRDKSRKTTVKTRIISAGQHLLRVDDEIDSPLETSLEKKFIDHLKNLLETENIDIIIFEDYDKGVITPAIIEEIAAIGKQKNIPVLADPKKRNFLYYKNISLFKPNFKEFNDGLKLDIKKGDYAALYEEVKKYHIEANIEYILITLSELGIFMSNNGYYQSLPAEIHDIADVSGAGDTVISVAALCLKAGLKPAEIAVISNLAGGLVCEKVGVVPINKRALLDECIEYFAAAFY